jgi:acyl carrier protein
MHSLLSDKDFETVQDILVEQLGVVSDQLTPEAHLRNDLGADSLTEIEVGMALEERFSLSIPDDQLENVRTVGDVYELLAKLLAARNPH